MNSDIEERHKPAYVSDITHSWLGINYPSLAMAARVLSIASVDLSHLLLCFYSHCGQNTCTEPSANMRYIQVPIKWPRQNLFAARSCMDNGFYENFSWWFHEPTVKSLSFEPNALLWKELGIEVLSYYWVLSFGRFLILVSSSSHC